MENVKKEKSQSHCEIHFNGGRQCHDLFRYVHSRSFDSHFDVYDSEFIHFFHEIEIFHDSDNEINRYR